MSVFVYNRILSKETPNAAAFVNFRLNNYISVKIENSATQCCNSNNNTSSYTIFDIETKTIENSNVNSQQRENQQKLAKRENVENEKTKKQPKKKKARSRKNYMRKIHKKPNLFKSADPTTPTPAHTHKHI